MKVSKIETIEEYNTIKVYLNSGICPEFKTRTEKFLFVRKCNNFTVFNDTLLDSSRKIVVSQNDDTLIESLCIKYHTNNCHIGI